MRVVDKIKGFFKKPKTYELNPKVINDEQILKLLNLYRSGEISLTTSQRYVNQILKPFIDNYYNMDRRVDYLEKEVALLRVKLTYKYPIDKDLERLSVIEELEQVKTQI